MRLQSLLRFSKFSISDIKDAFKDCKEVEEIALSLESDELVSVLESDKISMRCVDIADSNLCFYLGGFLAHSLSKTTSCDSCKMSFRANVDPPDTVDEIEKAVDRVESIAEEEYDDDNDLGKDEEFFNNNDDESVSSSHEGQESEESLAEKSKLKVPNHSQLIEIVSRGGLSTPTDLLFSLVCYLFNFYTNISNSKEAKSVLFSSTNPLKCFTQAVLLQLEDDDEAKDYLFRECIDDHSNRKFVQSAAGKMFKLFARNLMAEKNDSVRKNVKRKAQNSSSKTATRSKNARKIAKLQSQTL